MNTVDIDEIMHRDATKNIQIKAPEWTGDIVSLLAEERGCSKGDVLAGMCREAAISGIASAHPAYEAALKGVREHLDAAVSLAASIAEAAEANIYSSERKCQDRIADVEAARSEAQRELERLRGLADEAADARRSADELRAALGDKSKRIEELEGTIREAREAIEEAKDAKLAVAAAKDEASAAALDRERAAAEADRLKVRCEDLQEHIDMLMGQISMKDEQIKALAAR